MNKFLSYLEKNAGAVADMARGYISPAWQENHIAKQHGKEGLKGVGPNVGKHITGAGRYLGRAMVESVAGGAAAAGAGALVAKLAKKDVAGAAMQAGIIGQNVGAMHGIYKSLRNQNEEAHKKYSGQEKKAAYDALLEQGLGHDTAIELIEKEASLFQAAARVGAQVAGKAKTFATATKADAMKVPGQAKQVFTGKTTLNGTRFKSPISSGGRTEAGKALGMNKAVQTGAAAAAGVGLASAMSNRNQEKRACLDLLIAEGLDLETAVDLVKQAEQELYGNE